MIKVNVKTNEDGFMNINVEGHAESSICASVSTLLQSNVRFLQELSRQFPDQIKVEVHNNEKHSYAKRY